MDGIFGLWVVWMLSSLSLLAVALAPLALRPIWVPALAAILEVTFFLAIRRAREKGQARCLLSMFVTTRILFWCAVTMLAILMIYRYLTPEQHADFGLNTDIPFIPILIVAPIGALVSWWMLRRGPSFPFCVDCKLRYGSPAERGFIGKTFSREGTMQVRVYLVGFAIMTVSSWLYYALRYVNVNLNSADIYFFFAVPAAMWVIAALYMTLRYLGLWRYYAQDLEGSTIRNGSSSRLRFLIIADNRLLVTIPDPTNPDAIVDLLHDKADTPATLTLPFRRDLPLYEAERYLEGILPVSNPRVRYLYTTTEWNSDCNTFHFIANITNEEDIRRLESAVKSPAWLTLREFSEMVKAGAVDSLLASEIHRIYTMAMAFKSYDHNGRRLYPIKHYRPTFRLTDIIDYKLDYNDRHWLYVAHCNQDEPFYRLRSLWRRHVNGLSY